jgi:hypothetical protein
LGVFGDPRPAPDSLVTAMEKRGRPEPDLLQVAKSLATDRTTVEVVSAFERAGIRSILLKGPSIQSLLYEYEEWRFYGDSDLLISPDQIAEAENVLSDLGFVHLPLDDIPHDRPWHAHAWFRERDGCSVDLHRTLIGAGAEPRKVWSVLSANVARMKVLDSPLEVLSPAGRAMHIVLHAAQDGVLPTKSVPDLRRALAQLPLEVWEEAWQIASSCEALPAFVAGLRFVPEGAALVGRLGLESEVSTEAVLRMSGERQAVAVDWLWSTPGIVPKLRFVAHKLFPPVAFIKAWSPIRWKGGAGIIASYIYRVFWLLLQSPRASMAWARASARTRRRGHRRARHEISSEPAAELRLTAKIRLALNVWRAFAWTHIFLRRRRLPDIVAACRSQSGATGLTIDPIRLGWIVYRLLRVGPYHARCLVNSLVLLRLLYRQGYEADLVIGLPEIPDDVEAHSWLEIDGRDVGPPPGRGDHVEFTRY